MHKKEFIIEVNSADDGDILICQLPKDWLPPIPIKKELIRCKDCTYRQEDGYCPITDCYDFDDKDYCSKAERKEEWN